MPDLFSAPSHTVNRSPLFQTPDGWSPGYALARGHGPGVVVGPGVDNPNTFAQSFSTEPREQFKVIARAASVDGSDSQGVVQINWHDANGNFISLSRHSFALTQTARSVRYDVTAPPHAAYGTLYVIPGGPKDVIRYTEMTLARFDAFDKLMSYSSLGIKDYGIALSTALILLFVLLYSRHGSRVIPASASVINRLGKVVVVSFPLVALILCGAVFVFMEGNYEQHYDSQWHQGSIENVMEWKHFSIDLGGNILHNFGIQHVINPQLSPTFWVGSILPQDHRIQFQAAFQAMVLFLIMLQICRLAGARLTDASAIGFIAAYYCWVPILSDEYISLNATLGLLWQEGAIATLLAFFCFAQIGYGVDKASPRAWPIFGLAATILWLYLAYPEIAVFFTMATMGLCAGAVLGVESRRELFYKVVASVGIVAILLMIGIHKYVINLFAYTPQMTYDTLHYPFSQSLFFSNTSLLLLYAWYGIGSLKIIVFYTLAVLGSIFALYYGNSFARRVVLAGLSFELGLHLVSPVNIALELAPLSFTYVEYMGLTVVAMLAGTGVWGLLQIGMRSIGAACLMAKARSGTSTLLSLSAKNPYIVRSLPYVVLYVMAGTILYQLSKQTNFYSGWPPGTGTEPAQIQISELAVRPGETFKGRGAVLLEMGKKEPVSWGKDFFPVLYYKHRVALQNDLMNDAEVAGIPIVNEYGHWISPPMLALLATAFYRSDDRIDRAAQSPRVFRPNLARLLGVSLVVSNEPLPGEVELFRGLAVDYPLYMHRIVGANLGGYSPTRTVVAKNAEDILNHLQAADFDGRKLAILEKPLDLELVSAEQASMKFQKGPTIQVTAYSKGISLLVLPIDYSHCLQVKGEGLDQMMPVNLAQTGLVIHGTVSLEISYRYGLLNGTSCRKRDLERVRQLQLAEAATGRLFYDSRQGRIAGGSSN
jgi:hypothetical protein